MANLLQSPPENQAQAWQAYAAGRARFDVERKAAEALAFVQQRGARTFALPTKLVGTKAFQENLRLVRELAPAVAELEAKPDPAEPGEIMVVWGGNILGHLQAKHVGWVRPLLATRKLRFFLLQITGGTQDKPTCGVNVVIAGIPAALEAQARGYGFRVRPKAVTAAA